MALIVSQSHDSIRAGVMRDQDCGRFPEFAHGRRKFSHAAVSLAVTVLLGLDPPGRVNQSSRRRLVG
ncbi:MAG: hypothetical protein KDJ77_19380, partial [Rhodobiaceae bacterium]|nr:hypothetical protein [Rhodobiaceae bacterium]